MSAPHADDRHPHRPDEDPPSRNGTPRTGRHSAVLESPQVPGPRAAPGAGAPGAVPPPRAPTAPPGADTAPPVADTAPPGADTAPPGAATGAPVAPPPDPPAGATTGPVRDPQHGPHTPPLPWSAVGAPPVAPEPAATEPAASPGGTTRATAVAGTASDLPDRLRQATTRTFDAAVRHRTVVLAASLVVLIAAGIVGAAYTSANDDGGPVTPDATTPQAAAPVPADLVAGTTAADPATFASGTFRTPSGNIACRMSDGEARCDTDRRSWTPPADPACSADPGAGLVVGGPGGARPSCGGSPVDTDGGPELGYGTHLTRGDVTCVSRRSGVECRDARTGHGLETARSSYRLY